MSRRETTISGRRPTMADVARAAGVSVMTVSYAYSRPDRVSAKTAANVRAAAARLGYPGPHPGARSLRRGRAGSIGVVLGEPLTYAFEDPQAARFLAGVAAVCAADRAGLTLVPITGRPDDVDRVADAVVDGFVVWTTADDDPVVDAVAATGLPAAVHGGPGRGLPVVTIDNRAAARAVDAAAFAGARRPAVVSFPFDRRRRSAITTNPDPATATFPITRERLKGYLEASSQPVRVAVSARNSAAEGARLAAALFAGGDPPDAIAAMSDELALGVLRAAAQARATVPVTGWDDTDAAEPAGLTTVRQSLHDQGAECARIALGRPPQAGAPKWRVIRRASTRRE
jgi:DNA-binding LacI/PurR family transcriptional regulator